MACRYSEYHWSVISQKTQRELLLAVLASASEKDPPRRKSAAPSVGS
jgi:hypothetical protein